MLHGTNTSHELHFDWDRAEILTIARAYYSGQERWRSSGDGACFFSLLSPTMEHNSEDCLMDVVPSIIVLAITALLVFRDELITRPAAETSHADKRRK